MVRPVRDPPAMVRRKMLRLRIMGAAFQVPIILRRPTQFPHRAVPSTKPLRHGLEAVPKHHLNASHQTLLHHLITPHDLPLTASPVQSPIMQSKSHHLASNGSGISPRSIPAQGAPAPAVTPPNRVLKQQFRSLSLHPPPTHYHPNLNSQRQSPLPNAHDPLRFSSSTPTPPAP